MFSVTLRKIVALLIVPHQQAISLIMNQLPGVIQAIMAVTTIILLLSEEIHKRKVYLLWTPLKNHKF